MKPTSGTVELKTLSKLFPNVTDLKITWDCAEDESVKFSCCLDFKEDLQPINSMKQIRKLEMDYMNEEKLAQLDLKQLQELHVTGWVNDVWNNSDLEFWSTFISNHSQLSVLHRPYCSLNVEKLQITLENLPLLKSLELGVKDFNFGFLTDRTKFSDEKFLAQYKKEQVERAAQLIGENYDRFDHLKLYFPEESCGIETDMLDHLKKYYPGVNLTK
jgi:hypothetical protein